MAITIHSLFKDTYNTALTANDSTPQEELGILRAEFSSNKLKIYQYVQAADDTTVENGTVVCALAGTSFDGYTVTSDISDSDPNYVVGVGIGAITAEYYGWVQIYGEHTAIYTDQGEDISASDCLIADPTADGDCDSVAADTAPTNKVLGWALAADVHTAQATVHGLIVAGGFCGI